MDMQPFMPSKWQYREVDASISLREQNCALMASNKVLVQQQAILVENAEHASQLARQSKIQHRKELKAIQSAQDNFQKEMMRKFQFELAKLQVSQIAWCNFIRA